MATKPDDDTAFDDAFAQFATREDPKEPADDAPVAGDDKSPPADDAPGDDAPADDKGAADDAGAGGDDAAPDAAADDKPAEEEPAPGVSETDTAAADDVLARLSALLKDAPAKEEKPAEEQQQQLPDVYTDDEKAFLKTYDEDWADVAKGEALKRKAEYRDLMTYVFGEISKHMTPLAEMVAELATRSHLGDLQERVPDYNDLRDKVVEWVETQPAYLQVGMKEVMKTGTADEVTDLIERYRKETGAAAPAANSAPEQKVELSDDAKKAAKTLAPVDTKRSVVPQDDSLDDFDAAFAKFATTSKR